MGKLRRNSIGSGSSLDAEMVYLDEGATKSPKMKDLEADKVNHLEKHWEIMNQYMNLLNAHDLVGFEELWNPQGVVKFPLGDVPVSVLMAETEKLIRCFPDGVFYATGRECIFSDSRKGVFRVAKCGFEGTHTGEAYGFGPYKPIPASGVYVAPDPQFMILTIIDGRVQQIELTYLGRKSDPDYIYEAIGGQLQPSGEPIFATPRYLQSKRNARR